jgi:hypothetical protein
VSDSKITATAYGAVITAAAWSEAASAFFSATSFGPGSKTWTMPLTAAPPSFEFGNVLRYPIAEDPDKWWLFMFLTYGPLGDCEVMVLKAPTTDDIWEMGTIVYAGQYELELAE